MSELSKGLDEYAMGLIVKTSAVLLSVIDDEVRQFKSAIKLAHHYNLVTPGFFKPEDIYACYRYDLACIGLPPVNLCELERDIGLKA